MNPTFLDDMSWEMAEVYGAVSDQILINIAHYFPWYDESKLPRSTFAYMSDMLAQMGKVSRDAVNIIHRNLDGADKALRGILEQAIIDSIRATNPPLLDAAKRGILQPAGVPIVAPNQMRAYSLYYKQAADKLNLVNTVMLESTQQAYAATVADVVARVQATQTALDIGAGEAITGVSSWNQATQHAIRRMADRGITGFIDHGGHRWSAEAYVAMDIRTTVANTARAAVWETNENFGNDLYSVSYHNGARPLCYPWQNKVISATDQARTVTDLDGNEITVYAQSDTTYGQAAGLFGINCKHYPNVFIPGVSLIRGEPQDEKANEIAYEQSQEQRRLERKLREDRRDLMMMKARGVPEEQIKAQQAKCEQSSQDIQDFCDSTGRARRRNREGVYTKRSFPAADTYDVTAFERTQQEQLAEYFANGGAQTGYTFGQNTQAAPISRTFTIKDATKTEAVYAVNLGGKGVQRIHSNVYTMPDGKRFVFKRGMVGAHQHLKPDELIEAYYKTPQALRDVTQNDVLVVDRYNPADAFWRKTYKNFGHSYLTAGDDEITIYRYDFDHDMDYLGFALDHEMGHKLDKAIAPTGYSHYSQSPEWQEAMRADLAETGRRGWRPYSENSSREDFADAVAAYSTDHEELTKAMPNRARLLESKFGSKWRAQQ